MQSVQVSIFYDGDKFSERLVLAILDICLILHAIHYDIMVLLYGEPSLRWDPMGPFPTLSWRGAQLTGSRGNMAPVILR